MNEIQRKVIDDLHDSPFRARAEWDSFLPHNLTVAWALGTKSFCEILTNQVMEDGRIAQTHQRLWIEANKDAEHLQKNGRLTNTVYLDSPQPTLEPIKDPDSLYEDQQLPDVVYGWAFIQALQFAVSHPNELVHYVRQDNSRVVEENDNNAPFRLLDGEWRKISE